MGGKKNHLKQNRFEVSLGRGWGLGGNLMFRASSLHRLCFYFSLSYSDTLMNHPSMANSGFDMNITASPMIIETSIKCAHNCVFIYMCVCACVQIQRQMIHTRTHIQTDRYIHTRKDGWMGRLHVNVPVTKSYNLKQRVFEKQPK